jgi:hypothetical protein
VAITIACIAAPSQRSRRRPLALFRKNTRSLKIWKYRKAAAKGMKK